MKSYYFYTFFSAVLLLVSPSKIEAQGLSFKNLNPCEKIPHDLFNSSQDNSILALKELPQGLYLVRSVSQTLENSKGEKYFSYQKLVSKEETKNHLCYQGTPNSEFKFQTFFPTVIDRTKDQKWGHAFWSMSVSANKTTGAVEANRSLIPSLDYREKLIEQGFRVEERQKSHHEYELKIERTIASWKEVIILLYDQY